MIYFDNSATTPVCTEAYEAAGRAMTEAFGNPGSVHGLGIAAKNTVEAARSQIAALLGCAPAEFYFSHSGTLANNTAIFGSAEARKKQGNRIITSSVEHPSVMRCMDKLEACGTEIIRLAPGADGKISVESLTEAINDKTMLVSIMLVNNETGAVNDIKALCAAAKKKNPRVIFHTDAIQAFGKLPFRVSSLAVDLCTVSGHKIHAPKGVGGLYIKKGLNVHNFVCGGGQENGMFSGTEPVPAIAGFGAAVAAAGNPAVNLKKVAEVRKHIAEGLEKTDGCVINSPADALPYILNVSVTGIPSQVLINYLSEKQIYVSAGSACKRGHRSEVLTAMELDPKLIDSAIRISLSRFSTPEDADAFVAAISDARKEIRTKL